MQNVKCVTVGDGAVGKTCMLISYTKDEFPEKHVPTVFNQENIVVDDMPRAGRKTNLGLWDTAGQDAYNKLRPLSYPDTDVFIVCYSIASPTTLKNVVSKWIPEIRFHGGADVPFLLVGTKADLRTDKSGEHTFVDFEDAQAKGMELGAERVLECSSKTRKGLKTVYAEAIKVALGYRDKPPTKRPCVLL